MSVTIYAIQCKVNNKIYIGQTTNYTARIKYHKNFLSKNKHTNPYLQEDYNKYGANNFIFYKLEEKVPDNLNLEKETYYMNLYGGTNSESIYNVKGNFNDDNKVYAKSKVAHFKGKYDAFKGHTHTSTSKQQICKSLKQAYKDGRHKLVGAVAGDCSGSNNSFYGKHHTEEVKQKLSKLRTKYDETFIQELRQLRNAGMSVVDIARKFDMNKNVTGSLIKYGTASRKKINEIKTSQNKV